MRQRIDNLFGIINEKTEMNNHNNRQLKALNITKCLDISQNRNVFEIKII